MKLSQIITSVRRLLQDDEYDAAVITEAANWFVYELFNNNRTRLMEDSTTIDASAGETTADFPTNALAWLSIYVTVPDVYDIGGSYVEYGDFMANHANFASASAGQARNWTEYAGGMRFSQPLLTDTTFNLDFVREPVEMTKLSDTCELPKRYAELVARGTKARVLEIDEEYTEADQERTILEPLVTTFIKNEARGGGKAKPTVIRTGRRALGSRARYIGQ